MPLKLDSSRKTQPNKVGQMIAFDVMVQAAHYRPLWSYWIDNRDFWPQLFSITYKQKISYKTAPPNHHGEFNCKSKIMMRCIRLMSHCGPKQTKLLTENFYLMHLTAQCLSRLD